MTKAWQCDIYWKKSIGRNIYKTHKWINTYQLIDILIKPFLNHVKSFARDSLDFLNKCPRDVDEGTEIVTLDVISLHTSIPHEFGLEAINYFFTKY